MKIGYFILPLASLLYACGGGSSGKNPPAVGETPGFKIPDGEGTVEDGPHFLLNPDVSLTE